MVLRHAGEPPAVGDARGAERTTRTVLAEQLVAAGLATAEELEQIGAAWLAWAEHPDAWFIVPNGELLCHLT